MRQLKPPGLLFVGLSLLLLSAFVVIYTHEVREALAMDPTSYNCSDSMMKQFCEDPYGASLVWSVLSLFVMAWPLLFAWAAAGIWLLIHRKSRQITAVDSAKTKSKLRKAAVKA